MIKYLQNIRKAYLEPEDIFLLGDSTTLKHSAWK